MNAKLRLFFKSRYYRKMHLLTLKTSIIDWIKFPFLWIKSVYETIKICINNPNRWERYLKFKEIEHNNKLEEERLETAKLRVNFIGEITRLSICVLTYCSYNDASNVPESKYKATQDEFNATRENVKNQIIELERRNIVIPSELKTIIESTNLDSFKTLDDCQEFYQKLKSLFDEMINVTKA